MAKGKEEEFVHCAHKYREGCDVDTNKIQPWMMIVGIAVLLVVGGEEVIAGNNCM